MALESQKAYLHLITGGFDNAKRREVRKLFSIPSKPQEEEEMTTKSLDIAVGLLEEFYSIGVKEFVLSQAEKTLEIFGLKIVGLSGLLGNPRLRLQCQNNIWSVPDQNHIENLKTQFCNCSEEALSERKKELFYSHRDVL